MMKTLLPLVLVMAGCFSPTYPNGVLLCAQGNKPCPDGYHCTSGACWRDGTDPDLGTATLPDLAVADQSIATIPDLQGPVDFDIPDGNHLGHALAASGGAVSVSGPAHQLTLSVGQHFSGTAAGTGHKAQLGVLFGTHSK
jgi:hypothetical protein